MDGTIGEIRLFAGNFAPRNWAICSGQILAISTNQALFSILGTTYGGDGQTSFALPDCRGRGVISSGTGPGLSNYNLGTKQGTEENYLHINQLPNHSHTGEIHVSSEVGDLTDPSGNFIASTENEIELYQSSSNATMETNTLTTGFTGGGLPLSNRQPYNSVNYIICLLGLFPSRN